MTTLHAPVGLAPEISGMKHVKRTPPPPLRLPRYLLSHLARPLRNEDNVDALIAQIRMADYRGLL